MKTECPKIVLPDPDKYIKTQGIKLDEHAFYAWFPIVGNSMTSKNHQYSIPEGSKVLVKEVQINSIFDYPLNRPVVIMGVAVNELFRMLKTISFINGVNNSIRCSSLNPDVEDFYIAMQFISRVFVVVQIMRPRSRKAINVII